MASSSFQELCSLCGAWVSDLEAHTKCAHQNGEALEVPSEEAACVLANQSTSEGDVICVVTEEAKQDSSEGEEVVLLKLSDDETGDSGFSMSVDHPESAEALAKDVDGLPKEKGQDLLRTVQEDSDKDSGETLERGYETDFHSPSSPSSSSSSSSSPSSASGRKKSAFVRSFHERIIELPELKFFDNVYNAVYICRICRAVIKPFRKHINEHLNECHSINLLQYYLLYYQTENWSDASLYKCLECQHFYSMDKCNFGEHLKSHDLDLQAFSKRFGILAYARSILHCHICNVALFHEQEILKNHAEYHGINMEEFLMGMRTWFKGVIGVNNNFEASQKKSIIRQEVRLTKDPTADLTASEPKKSKKPTALKWATECRYQCKLCDGGAVINGYLSLQRHMSIVHKTPISMKVNCVRVEKVKHECHLCGKRILSDYQMLYSHMKQRHNLSLLQYDDVFMTNRTLEVLLEHMPSAEWDLSLRKAKRYEAIKRRKSLTAHFALDSVTGSKTAPEKNRMETIPTKIMPNVCARPVPFSSRQPRIELVRLEGDEIEEKLKRARAARHTGRRTSIVARAETERAVGQDDVAASVVTPSSLRQAWYQGCVFQCSGCSKTSYSGSSLRLHMKSAHGLENFKSMDHLVKTVLIKCQICSEDVLADYDFVRSHLRFHNLKVIDYALQFYPDSIDKDRTKQRFVVKTEPETKAPIDSATSIEANAQSRKVPSVEGTRRKRLKSDSPARPNSSFSATIDGADEAQQLRQRSQSVSGRQESNRGDQRPRVRTLSCVEPPSSTSESPPSRGKRRRSQSTVEEPAPNGSETPRAESSAAPIQFDSVKRRRKVSETGATKKAVALVAAVPPQMFTEWYNGCSYSCPLCSKKTFFRGAKSLRTHLCGDHSVEVEARLEQLVEKGRETPSYVQCLICNKEAIVRDYFFLEAHFKRCHDMSAKDYFDKFVQVDPR